MRDNIVKHLAIGLVLCVIGISLFIFHAGVQWGSTAVDNKVEYVDKKIDERTSYETRKKVEDTARSMISSYESDKLTYEQYKDSDSEEKVSWGEQAKMRANKTVSTYNNYVLTNSFVFEGNIPEDIKTELPIIQ